MLSLGEPRSDGTTMLIPVLRDGVYWTMLVVSAQEVIVVTFVPPASGEAPDPEDLPIGFDLAMRPKEI